MHGFILLLAISVKSTLSLWIVITAVREVVLSSQIQAAQARVDLLIAGVSVLSSLAIVQSYQAC